MKQKEISKSVSTENNFTASVLFKSQKRPEN